MAGGIAIAVGHALARSMGPPQQARRVLFALRFSFPCNVTVRRRAVRRLRTPIQPGALAGDATLGKPAACSATTAHDLVIPSSCPEDPKSWVLLVRGVALPRGKAVSAGPVFLDRVVDECATDGTSRP